MNMTWTCRCLEYHKFQEIFMHYSIPLECVLCVCCVCVCVLCLSVCFSFLLVWLVSTFDSRFGVCSAWNAKCTMHHKYTRNTHTHQAHTHTQQTHTLSTHTHTCVECRVAFNNKIREQNNIKRKSETAGKWVSDGERETGREREQEREREWLREWVGERLGKQLQNCEPKPETRNESRRTASRLQLLILHVRR